MMKSYGHGGSGHRPRHREAVTNAPKSSLSSSPTSQLYGLTNRSDTIDFSTVYSNQEVSELFTLAMEFPNDHRLADDAVDCLPLLVDGSRKWLGYSNVSIGVIGKFIKVLRKHRSRSYFCIKALRIIIAFCADIKVTHDPNVQRLSDVSAIKVITLILQQHLVTNKAEKRRYSLLLGHVVRRWQNMNIDGNVQNRIFSYLYSQKQNDVVVELCCQLIITFAGSESSKVKEKMSKPGCCEALIEVLKNASTAEFALLGLRAIDRIDLQSNRSRLIVGDFFEALIPLLCVYKNEFHVVCTGLVIILNILDSCAYSSDNMSSLFVMSCKKILHNGGCEMIMEIVETHIDDHIISILAWKIMRRMMTRFMFNEEHPSIHPHREIRNTFQRAGMETAFNLAKEAHANNDEVMNELGLFVTYSLSDRLDEDLVWMKNVGNSPDVKDTYM